MLKNLIEKVSKSDIYFQIFTNNLKNQQVENNNFIQTNNELHNSTGIELITAKIWNIKEKYEKQYLHLYFELGLLYRSLINITYYHTDRKSKKLLLNKVKEELNLAKIDVESQLYSNTKKDGNEWIYHYTWLLIIKITNPSKNDETNEKILKILNENKKVPDFDFHKSFFHEKNSLPDNEGKYYILWKNNELITIYYINILVENGKALAMFSKWKKEKEEAEIEIEIEVEKTEEIKREDVITSKETQKNRIEVVGKSKDKPVFVFKEQNENEKKTFIEALSVFITLPFVIATPFEQSDSKDFATNIYSYLQGEMSYEKFSNLDTIAKLLLFNQHDVGLICLRLFFQSTSDFGAISNQQHTELTRRIYTLFNISEEKLKITSFSKTIRGNILSPKFSSKLNDIDNKELKSQIDTFVKNKTENEIVKLFKEHIKNTYN